MCPQEQAKPANKAGYQEKQDFRQQPQGGQPKVNPSEDKSDKKEKEAGRC